MFNPLYTENRIMGTLAKSVLLPNIVKNEQRDGQIDNTKTVSHLSSGWQTVVNMTYLI